MAALTATAWGVSVQERWIEGGKRHSRVQLTLDGATSSAFYPSGGVGIALPSHGKFGMKRNLEMLIVYGGSDDGIMWRFNATGNTLQGYVAPTALGTDASLIELPTTWSPTTATISPIILVEAVGG